MINLIYALIFAVLMNVLIFIIAFIFKSDKLTDLTYSLTFILISLFFLLYNHIALSKTILFLMILIWALRLGGYLFYRINKIKKDSRFDKIRANFFKFLFFWIFQGITAFIILVPSMLYFNSETKLSYLSFIGIFVFLIGFLIETISDIQKFNFIINPKNKNKWIEHGLWKYSRHPNYFGEMLVWIGIYVYCINSISWIYGIISPLFLIFILRYVSGVPMLEKKNNEKFKNNKKYLEYKKKTNMFIVWPK